MKTVGISYDQIDNVPLEHINGYMMAMEQQKEKKKPMEKNQVPPKTDWGWIAK